MTKQDYSEQREPAGPRSQVNESSGGVGFFHYGINTGSSPRLSTEEEQRILEPMVKRVLASLREPRTPKDVAEVVSVLRI